MFRTENHVLADTVGNRIRKLVLGIAAPRSHKPAKIPSHRLHRALHKPRISLPNQAECNGIVQYRRFVGQLVRSASNCNTQSGLAGPASLHEIQSR